MQRSIAWSLLALLGATSACTMQTATTGTPVHRSAATTTSDAGATAADGGASTHDGGSTAPTADMDPSASLASIAGARYESSPYFWKVSRAPYASVAAQGSSIDVYVSADAYNAYTEVAPEATGSKAELPAGAMIVRAVSDATGKVTKVTLMIKGPTGYNPSLGDWWFGVTAPDGTPLNDTTSGKELTGRLDQCYSCHIPRASDDFLFGVPMADRGPHP